MAPPTSSGAARRSCLSRRAGQMCTREAGHRGLHNRVGTGSLWSEREADAPRCPGGGQPAQPAAALPDGYPGGRALCSACWGFVPMDGGALAEHDSWRGDADEEESDRRRAWFNTHGW